MSKTASPTKLKTGNQCRKAINEIKQLNGWSLFVLANEIEITYETLRKVSIGYTKMPRPDIAEKLAIALDQARADQ